MVLLAGSRHTRNTMTKRILTITATGIAHNGAAFAEHEGKKVYIHGMLPGETALVSVEKKHRVFFGSVEEFIVRSSERKEPNEAHYLSCSPWQVMHYPTQCTHKRQLLSDLYGRYAHPTPISFTPADDISRYRTKIEFSFTDKDQAGNTIPLSLSFRERNNGKHSVQLDHTGCILASNHTNSVGIAIASSLASQGFTYRDTKALTIRESKTTGDCIAILYLKERKIPHISWKNIPHLIGLHIYYSTHKSPAAVPTELLVSEGAAELTETLQGVTLSYAWDSFFQNNIPLFLNAVAIMREHVPPSANILELYSGVGTIGLLLASSAKSVHGVEIHPHSVAMANKNAQQNAIRNYTAEAIPSEHIPKVRLAQTDCLVLDPPRAGLHPKLISAILETQPPILLYLSCNPETQARDYAMLSEKYDISHIHGFDFYPNTPHLESLLVLKKRG